MTNDRLAPSRRSSLVRLLLHQVLEDLDPIAPQGLTLFLHDVDEVVYGIRLVLNRIDEGFDPVSHVRLP